MQKNKIIVVTGNKYPEGDAGALRQHVFAKIFSQCGYEPVVYGMGKSTSFQISKYDGIKYCSLKYEKSSLFYKALGRLLFSYNLRKQLFKISVDSIQGILIVSGDKRTFDFVKRLAKKNDISLYHDSVEWYSPCEFTNGENNRAYRENNKLNIHIIDREFKVIAISKYLYNYFYNKGIKAIRIPVILDIKNLPSNKNTSYKYVKIVYAGTLNRKDHLFELIQAVESLDVSQRDRLKLEIIGVTREQFETNVCEVNQDLLVDNITFLGRIDHSEVLEKLIETDFTVLLRPSNERYAKAGFPTKVVESLASATPVLCNYSSDLELYLNEKNAVVVDDCTTEACIVGLRKILRFTVQERKDMQKNARLTAEQYFDYRNYIDDISDFIKN